jgi:hypothetical protein
MESTTLRAALAIFRKDWRSEWRSRSAVNAIGLFALATPIALSLGVAGQKLSPQVLAGLLWATLLFASLIGLSRVWVKEDESGTGVLLRLHAAPQGVLWGKTVWNLSLLAAMQAGAVPIFVLLLGARVESVGLLVGTLVLANIGPAPCSAPSRCRSCCRFWSLRPTPPRSRWAGAATGGPRFSRWRPTMWRCWPRPGCCSISCGVDGVTELLWLYVLSH